MTGGSWQPKVQVTQEIEHHGLVSSAFLHRALEAGLKEVRSDGWATSVDSLDALGDAVFAAGAGRIGEYERCSWYTEGTGTFFGGERTDPSIGEKGREERVPEVRLETVFPEERQLEVVKALRSAHPYEEPAFDIYPLA